MVIYLECPKCGGACPPIKRDEQGRKRYECTTCDEIYTSVSEPVYLGRKKRKQKAKP